MDYPKSLPGTGLVNGRFVDENPLTGAIGSLIPAQWGNAVTEEVLNVIQSAGLAADEQDNAQLKSAIEQKITQSVVPVASVQDAEQGTDNVKRMTPLRVFQAIAKRVVQASESIAGVAKTATQAQTDGGADNTTIVTPKTLRFGFSASLTTNGYIVFPTWLGGFIIQWVGISTLGIQGAYSSFALAFPNTCLAVFPSTLNGSAPGSVSLGAKTQTGFTLYSELLPCGFCAIAFGR
ncbi:hypothetical protein SAMN04488483_2764 [Pseudomonas helmanticensis]|uniref:Uncharacterized protein n=1 Tax=Pseudomonas helmanticensis TaxID=1471381 RepID=A0ACD2U689_9PSED|nr:hypothetical protein [Pseudomonas helmanticensis]SMQ26115.1 hypothetical protein SAMN04488483_2764 [Pseudomonas helmanticensis]